MSPETRKRLCGNFCVVIRMDGTSEVKIVEEGESVFDKAKEIIGCRWLDHFIVQTIQQGGRDCVEVLVNDEGYIDWGNDPAKVNQIATYLYNGGEKPGHYILGDAVLCLMVDGEDGGEFIGLSYALANTIAKQNNEDTREKAAAIVPRPSEVPDPVVKISSYETTEDMIRAMKGDKTVKPKDETILSGVKKDGGSEA